jgi:hypothetical protein
MGKGEVYTWFCWGIQKEGDHQEEPGVDGGIIMGLIFSKWVMGAWIGSIYFRARTGGGYL